MNIAKTQTHGFTLIEVLLALAIIAIALTALIKSTASSVMNTQRLKEKTISHWVAMQGVSMLQLGLIPIDSTQEITQVTQLLNQQWYWRINISKTPFSQVQKIKITVSKNHSGPFSDELIAFIPSKSDKTNA